MKIKRLFSGLLVSLIAIVSVLLCVKVSNAEETKVDVLTASMFKATSTKYTDFSGVSGTSGAVYAGNSANNKGMIQLRSDKKTSGIVTTTSGGIIKKISVSWGSSTANERTLDIYGKSSAYTGAADLYESSTQGEKLGSIVNGTSTEISIDGEYQYVGLRSNSGAMYLASISIEWGEPVVASDYSVSFDANGATFATGAGKTITTAVGTPTTVPLPTIDVLVYGCKEIMPLSGWSDGTTTHKPGTTVTVSEATKYTAVYLENNSKTLSVEEAIEVAKLVGSTGTTNKFQVTGVISAFDSKYPDTFTIVDETDNTKELKLYNPATKVADSKVVVGDKVVGNGIIKNYNGTYELDKDCTYEKVTAPKPATAVEFEKVETMSSLSFDWTTDGNDYSVSNVSLRFGNLFTNDAYAEGATYGVLLIQNSDLAGSDFATYLAGKTLKEINDDSKIINVEATPVKVNAEGVADENGEYYQFAAVLSDMDEYLTASVTAVMYVVIDGQIYYSVEKTASVKSTADAYFKDAALMETLDENVQYALLTLTE